MRKLLVTALAAATALSTLAMTDGTTTDRGAPGQYVSGSIEAPTRFTDPEQGWPGLVRRTYNCSTLLNGTIGYVLPVYEESWGGEFELVYTGDQTGLGDLDVLFYEELSDCSGEGDPITAGPYYDSRGEASGETGIVPERARFAVVYMATGLQATFTYEDWEAPVVQVTNTSGDTSVTLARGGDLRIANGTSTYLEVDAPGDRDDRTGDGNGVPIGQEYRLTMSTAGTFTFVANGRTITVHVVG